MIFKFLKRNLKNYFKYIKLLKGFIVIYSGWYEELSRYILLFLLDILLYFDYVKYIYVCVLGVK